MMTYHDFAYCEPSIDSESGVTQRSDIRGYFLSNYGGVRFCDDVASYLILLNQNFHWNVTPQLICSFFRRLNQGRE
jgi:hypothetical protein